MLAITNTPFDLPVNYAASGRAIYQPHVMECYLPHEIEPFYEHSAKPVSFGPNDDFDPNGDVRHCNAPGVRGRDPEDEFVAWRRQYMGWHTEDELRKDAKKRAESQRNFERLLAALDEVKKKHSCEKKQMRSAK